MDADTQARQPGADHRDHEDGYAGPVTVRVGPAAGTSGVIEVPVEATLRGHFEPLDGRYHWYGRLAASAELAAHVGGGKVGGEIVTPHGAAAAELGDVDPWGRLRVSGTSTPPFPLLDLDDLEGPGAGTDG
jgi:hypothetical protein